MRAATARSTPMKTARGPSGAPSPHKPDGGYQFIPTPLLVAAWRLRREGAVDAAGLRVWFAAWEMQARRRPAPAALPRRFGLDELRKLTGLTPARIRRSLPRLATARLLDWSEAALGFPDPASEASPELRERLQEDLARFPRPGGRVPVPRRILRLLARGVRPALAATILGCLARCLRFRGGVLEGRGRVKASWIAGTFGLSERRVKEARGELIALGWIVPLEAGQSALNRWGLHVRVDLRWSPPADFGRSKSSPPPADLDAKSSPLPSKGKPLKGAKDQEPARRGPAGFSTKHGGGEDSGATPPRARSAPLATSRPRVAPLRRPAAPPSPGRPDLRDVTREDLDEVGRTLELYEQAVAGGSASPGEWGRLRFLAAAVHARAVGTRNPCGLFARLVRDGLWGFATLGDEEEASRRLRLHLNGPRSGPPPSPAPPSRPTASAPGGPPLSEDARFVRAIVQAAARRGPRVDPFLAARRGDATWTRARWDRAASELQRRRSPEGRRGVAPPAPPGLGTLAPGRLGPSAPFGLGA